jgi:structural maintenance of chromosomes protein 5
LQTISLSRLQELVRGSIKDQEDTTRIGIKYLQIGANKAALEDLAQEKDAEYTEALAEFGKGEFSCQTLEGEVTSIDSS